jgi:hypothetical protein
MKAFGKIVGAILVVLVLLCVAGALWLGTSERGKQIVGFTTGVTHVARSAKAGEALNKKYAFTAPEDGVVKEDRLLLFVVCCNEIKPAVEPYKKWMDAHRGEDGDFKDAQEVIKLTAGVMDSAAKTLDANQMSPREFGWISRTLAAAADEAGPSGATELEREMFQSYSQVLDFQGLDREEREWVSKEVQRFKERLGDASAEGLSANAQLYRRHADALKACDLGDAGWEILAGFTQSGHHRSHQVEIED